MTRRLAGPVALLAGLAGLAFLAVNGSAAYRTSHYTYNDSRCHKRSDPVNVILSGPNATAGYVGDRIYLVTGWNSHSGSTQRFLTGGSGAALGLPGNFHKKGLLAPRPDLEDLPEAGGAAGAF